MGQCWSDSKLSGERFEVEKQFKEEKNSPFSDNV